jgi:hypothetical protein
MQLLCRSSEVWIEMYSTEKVRENSFLFCVFFPQSKIENIRGKETAMYNRPQV